MRKATGKRVAMLGALFAVFAVTSCYAGENGGPGDTVRRIGALGEVRAAYALVRVVAPAGARRCWVDNASLGNAGPQRSEAVGPDGTAMIAVSTNMNAPRFACRGRDGEQVRVVQRIVLQWGTVATPRLPPMIHVAGVDARSDARWAALQTEICGADTNGLLCGERFVQLRMADIGR